MFLVPSGDSPSHSLGAGFSGSFQSACHLEGPLKKTKTTKKPTRLYFTTSVCVPSNPAPCFPSLQVLHFFTVRLDWIRLNINGPHGENGSLQQGIKSGNSSDNKLKIKNKKSNYFPHSASLMSEISTFSCFL